MQSTAEAAGPCWEATQLRGIVDHPQTADDLNSWALTGSLNPSDQRQENFD